MNKKAIIAVCNTANKGKTSVLRELAGVLEANYGTAIRQFPPPQQPLGQGDIRWVGKITGLVVAIETQGDPNTGMQDRLDELVKKWKADVIFCTTRTKGDTVSAVVHIANTYGYEQIWTSTYQTQRDHHAVNQLNAQHILELAKTLGLLP